MTFKIQRGINISHWLSQCVGRSHRQTWFTQQDVAYLADLGFDHLRIPVDEKELWQENGRLTKKRSIYSINHSIGAKRLA